jgi:phage shock protein PspC (stress-responsive transcriptional regulator)
MGGRPCLGHDGDMNDTQQSPPPAGPEAEFDPRRLRSIADMTRSRDDRVVAGVCAGAARYLNVDPVVVRVVIAVLTVAGFAGVILYVAGWLLLPAEDEPRSILADWFKLGRNEEQVRVAGLVGAVILAALSIVGDSSRAWWGDSPWWLLPIALVAYVLWIRPRRRREERARHDIDPATDHDDVAAHTLLIAKQPPRTPREPRSPALLVLTASVAAIAVAATWIYDETRNDVHWTTYVAVALAVVAVGLLVGTVVGHGAPLIGIGIVLAITLAVGSLFPEGPIGAQTRTPTVAADVGPSYRHGVGQLELDLTQVSDVERLPGRTIRIDAGIGQTTVLVPAGLNVDVAATMDAGQISLFGREDDGTDVALADAPDQLTRPALTIDIDQELGRIEVIRR